jgi:precorrin-8X/cobalt-precorrin-8 methylmutase
VEGKGASAPGSSVDTCTLCDTFCTGACRVLTPHHHHHHGHGHDHGHDHGHGHGQGHHHHHYPHEAHPLGPVSVVRSGHLKYERDPDAITRRSFEIIRAEADLSRFGDAAAVAERIAHAAGDVSILSDLVLSEGLVPATREALAAGAPVVVDAEMTRHAISTRFVEPARVICRLNDPETAGAAKAQGTTRSAVAIRTAADAVDGGIVVIGNAPTALFALMELMREGVSPAAILAFPVGFVGAAESKAALVAMAPAVPYATLGGRRGGSAMAGAALNAIAAPR